MGGAIGFTIREKNGKQHRMCRWTNSFPWFTDSLALANHDPNHLKEYLDGWERLKKNYANKVESSADWLVPYAGLNPVEYGLIVVDYQTNTILDMNDYHFTGQISSPCLQIRLALVKGKYVIDEEDSDRDDYELFRSFVEAKRIPKVSWMEGKTEVVINTRDYKMEDFFEFLYDYQRNDKHNKWYSFHLDLSPFVVKCFEKNVAGILALRQAVLDLGFELTEEEESAWAEYVERRREYEDEDRPDE